jgi:ribokinase
MAGRIVVLGSLNQDLVVTMPRLPQPGETVLGEGLGAYAGGKGANQAVAAARLGGQVAMVGRVGDDSFGPGLIENLDANGVDPSGIQLDREAATGAALIYVARDGQNMIAVAPGANARLGADDVRRTRDRLLPGDVLVMQLEIPMAVVEQAAMVGRQAGARIVLNAAPAQRVDPGLLRQLDALVVNEREASALADQADAPQAEAAAAAVREHGARVVIVTLGAGGSLMRDDAGVHRAEAFDVQPVDSTGAGDAFMGALAVALAAGVPARAAIRFANAAGAAATTSVGAQAALPRLDELRRMFGLDLSSFART